MKLFKTKKTKNTKKKKGTCLKHQNNWQQFLEC